jgi:hypothetical protein
MKTKALIQGFMEIDYIVTRNEYNGLIYINKIDSKKNSKDKAISSNFEGNDNKWGEEC